MKGRPSKLTPKLQAELCKHISEGIPIDAACRLCDITPTTYHKWRSDGEQGKAQDKTDFLNAVEKAKAACIKRRVSFIEAEAKDGTWQAAAWLLERTQPEMFAQRSNLAVHQTVTPMTVEVKHPAVDIDRMAAILTALEAAGAINAAGGASGACATLEP